MNNYERYGLILLLVVGTAVAALLFVACIRAILGK